MLSKDDNELVCRVGPGTPMGNLMRQYWFPALLSSELPERDSSPVRVMLLGEEMIAFRATDGRVGLIQNACMHRGASMFFGRNEENGLRCVYHGWKYDVTGQCVDMPNEPAESNFKGKIRTTAYPCVERGGLVWTYMGPRETPPPLPDLEANMLLEGDCSITARMNQCNWLQVIEGDIDTCHAAFLHEGTVPLDATTPGTFAYYAMLNRAPRYEVIDTEYGTMYGAYRPAEGDKLYWRVAHFLFPFYSMAPPGLLGYKSAFIARIPIDDYHTVSYFVSAKKAAVRPSAGGPTYGMVGGTQHLPNTTDWYGRWRFVANKENDYLVDREAQKAGESYTGINGIQMQDQALTENMGLIWDRSKEHVGSSDAMIVQTRRRLLEAVKALHDHGTTPPGVDDPEVYGVRSGGVILPKETNWVEGTAALRKAFVQHPNLDPDIVGPISGVAL